MEAFFRAEYADRKIYRNVGTSVPVSLPLRLVSRHSARFESSEAQIFEEEQIL
jgi:hypothetical protein